MREEKRIALIPAYEPEKEMVKIAKELKEEGFCVVIINDGSSQECDSLFVQASEYAAIYTHTHNRGKGAAIKTGLEYIKNNFSIPYVIVTVDADGQHKVDDVLRVVKVAEENPNSLILGSRRFQGNVPWRSRLGNSITRMVYKVSSGLDVFDTQTGLRAFSDRMVEEMLSVRGERYEYEMNVLLELARKEDIKEVEIATVYLNDNQSSHFSTIKDSYRIYKEIIRFASSSLTSFLVDYGLYCLLFMISGAMVVSSILARMVSASLNYSLNRKFVFKSQEAAIESLPKYITLALCILLGNVILLRGIVSFGINAYLAKIITEIMMFVISWSVQRQFVFKKGTREGDLYEKA